MSEFKIFILMGVVFLFSTGASIIDNETKTNVSELSYKLDRLVQLEHAWNTENGRLLREQKEAIGQLNSRMDAFSSHIEASVPPVPQPASTTVTQSIPATPPEDSTKKSASLLLLLLFPYSMSGISLVLLIILFVRMRRGETEFRKRLWKNEVDALRNELTSEKPGTPYPNSKIHVTGDFRRNRLP